MFFFFNDTATPEIYTLSLHDALPILRRRSHGERRRVALIRIGDEGGEIDRGARSFEDIEDRKSTRLNSSHSQISYAVFCLKKKKKKYNKGASVITVVRSMYQLPNYAP